MNRVKQLISDYLPKVNIMQLATSVNDQPWVCTVHFYSDEVFNLYWVSKQASRHSNEILDNKRVAAAVVVHENTLAEDYVIGLSFVGNAEFLGTAIAPEIAKGYAKKHQQDAAFMSDVVNGQHVYQFYQLKPTSIVLFDNKNFPDNPRQELALL